MAYFPNGTSAMDFASRWCDGCMNFRERDWRDEVGPGCPLMDLHLLLDQYGACNETPDANPDAGGLSVTKFVLDFLIEDTEVHGYRCSMFVPFSTREDTDTIEMFSVEGEK